MLFQDILNNSKLLTVNRTFTIVQTIATRHFFFGPLKMISIIANPAASCSPQVTQHGWEAADWPLPRHCKWQGCGTERGWPRGTWWLSQQAGSCRWGMGHQPMSRWDVRRLSGCWWAQREDNSQGPWKGDVTPGNREEREALNLQRLRQRY